MAWSWLGSNRMTCASLSLFRQLFTSPGQEKQFVIIFIPLHVVVLGIQLSVETDNGRPSMVFSSFHSLMFITWHFEIASTPRKRERNILVPSLSMYALQFWS